MEKFSRLEFEREYLGTFEKLQECSVTDLNGNHCPENPIHTVIVEGGVTIYLCDKCYSNYYLPLSALFQ